MVMDSDGIVKSFNVLKHECIGVFQVKDLKTVYPISTGKLEGFNNKTKVTKRVGCGYRNDDYFFTLIKYLSLPSTRQAFHNFC